MENEFSDEFNNDLGVNMDVEITVMNENNNENKEKMMMDWVGVWL